MHIKQIIVGSLIGVACALPAAAQNGHQKFVQGFNAVELAGTTQGDVRARAYSNIALPFGKLELGYNGFNETNLNAPSDYIMRNVLLAGKTESRFKAAAAFASSIEGAVPTSGLRDTRLSKLTRGLGYADFTVGRDNLDFSALHVQPLPGNLTVEVYHNTVIPLRSVAQHSTYTEVVTLHPIRKNLDAFLRVEFGNARTCVIGLGKIITP